MKAGLEMKQAPPLVVDAVKSSKPEPSVRTISYQRIDQIISVAATSHQTRPPSIVKSAFGR